MIGMAIQIIEKAGWWPLLIGILACIIVGAIKTPIKKRFITEDLEEDTLKKRTLVFDVCIFLGSYLMALIGAIIYAATMDKASFGSIMLFSLWVWLFEFLAYEVWKKCGLKELCNYLLKLFIKDRNGDGEISLTEVVLQLREAYKDGKLDVDQLISDITENANENAEGVVDDMVEKAKSDSSELVTEVSEDVAIASSKAIIDED